MNIFIRTEGTKDSLDVLKLLFTKYDLLKRNPHVHLRADNFGQSENLMPLMTKQMKQLHFESRDTTSRCTLFTSGEFPFCPHFTNFTSKGFHIDDSVPSAFMKAVKDGKFPHLRRVDLNDCTLNNYGWSGVPQFSLEIGPKF